MILIEVFLTLLGLGILAAIAWLAFDYRDLRNRHEELAQNVTDELAILNAKLAAIKQRAGL